MVPILNLLQSLGWSGFCIVGTSVVLGSWWELATVILLAFLLAIRTGAEKQTLCTGHDGYDDDAPRIRWRLVPLT
jgi:protein-S-isoprenylcysteine O-methyltransferase Ste14